MGRRPKNYVPPYKPILMECVRCGESKAETEFYSNKQSRIYNVKKRVPICKECVQALYEELSDKYGQETAVFSLCAALDFPFLPETYKKITETNPPFAFGKYLRALQINQYRDKSFISSVAGKDYPKSEQEKPTSERLNRLQEDFSSLREELHTLKSEISVNQPNKSISKPRKTALNRKK